MCSENERRKLFIISRHICTQEVFMNKVLAASSSICFLIYYVVKLSIHLRVGRYIYKNLTAFTSRRAINMYVLLLKYEIRFNCLIIIDDVLILLFIIMEPPISVMCTEFVRRPGR